MATDTTAAPRRLSDVRPRNPSWASRRPWRISLDSRAILAGTSFVDRQRPALERLIVKAAYGLLSLSLVKEFDKGKSPQPTTFPICWKIHIRWGANGREVFSKLGFGRLVRKIPNE
jgi:hypothetical protein